METAQDNKIVVLGLCKAGTTSITKALQAAGISAAHWQVKRAFVGALMHQAQREGKPLFAYIPHTGITQMDCVSTTQGHVYFPQMSMLEEILLQYPKSRYILNIRPVDKHANSIMKWRNLIARLQQAVNDKQVPNFPSKIVSKVSLMKWIQWHNDRIRERLKGQSNFLEFNIETVDGSPLADFLGLTEIRYEKHNANASA